MVNKISQKKLSNLSKKMGLTNLYLTVTYDSKESKAHWITIANAFVGCPEN